MATTRYSFTFSNTDPTPFGPFPRWFIGQDPMLVAELNEAMMTASRGDWLHFVLGRVRDRLGGTALDFLFGDPDANRPDTEDTTFLLTALNPAELPGALALADAWRAAICADPEILATACERDLEFVAGQLASADFEEAFLGSEDGDEPAYLVGFLQRLRNNLAHASAAGATTLHVRC